jgi:hypothetical protein
MARASVLLSNFTSGELSPRLEGRIDLAKYFNGCKTLENFIVHPHGGATRRPGLRFISEIKDSSKQARLIPFIWNEDQAYIIELGDTYARFFYDQGVLLGKVGSDLGTNGGFGADTNWTKGTGWTIGTGVASSSGVQTSDSDLYQSIAFTSGLNYIVTFTVTARSAGKIQAVVGGTAGTERSSTGTFEESVEAGADGKLAFRADADFVGSIDNVTVYLEGTYEIVSPYSETQVLFIRYAQSADVLHVAHQAIAPQKLTRTSHTLWAFATLSFTAKPSVWTGTNYPGVVGFFEQRLWWGGTPAEPQTLWGSASGSYYDLTTGTDDDDALIYTIASNRVDMIRWIEPYRRLLVGTLGSEWSAGASSSLDPITPTNVRFEQENTFGSANIQGRLINNNLLFVGKHGYPLRQLSYDYTTDGFKGLDLGLLSGHIFGDGVSGFDFQQDPDSLLWLVRTDGVLLGCTYYPDQEVVSWHRHIIGGTEAEVESAAIIPGKYGHDELWVIVKRTINGSTKRYVEMMEGDFGDDIADAFFVDSGLTYDGSPADTLSGLDHLEGETVQVLADGAVHPDCVVDSGTIDLQWEASKIHVGLGYTSKLQTMRLEAGSQDGTAQGKVKRVHSAAVRFYNTVGGKMGIDEATLDRIPFRSTGDNMNEAVPMFNGDKIIKLPGGYNRDGRLWIEQDQPLPMTVLAIMPQLVTNDQ